MNQDYCLPVRLCKLKGAWTRLLAAPDRRDLHLIRSRPIRYLLCTVYLFDCSFGQYAFVFTALILRTLCAFTT